MLRVKHPTGSTGCEVVEPSARFPIMLHRGVEMAAERLALQAREQQPQGRADIAQHPDLDRRAAADRFCPDVDLGDVRGLRVELPIGKIGAQHQQGVAALHRVIAGGETDQPGHADIVGVLPLDIFLAAQGVDDRGFQRIGELQHLGMRTGATASAQQGHPLGVIQHGGEAAERFLRGGHDGPRWDQTERLGRRCRGDRFERHVAGDHDDADTALGRRPADRDLEHARHLFGRRDQLAIAAALLEQTIGVSLLEIAGADLGRGNMGGDRDHRHTRAVTVVQAVDQVQIARAAAAGADRELTGQIRLGAGGKGGDLFVAEVQPGDPTMAAQRVGEAIQAVADDAVNALYAGGGEGLDHLVGNSCGHGPFSYYPIMFGDIPLLTHGLAIPPKIGAAGMPCRIGGWRLNAPEVRS